MLGAENELVERTAFERLTLSRCRRLQKNCVGLRERSLDVLVGWPADYRRQLAELEVANNSER